MKKAWGLVSPQAFYYFEMPSDPKEFFLRS
jgi:hypothetical protein